MEQRRPAGAWLLQEGEGERRGWQRRARGARERAWRNEGGDLGQLERRTLRVHERVKAVLQLLLQLPHLGRSEEKM